MCLIEDMGGPFEICAVLDRSEGVPPYDHWALVLLAPPAGVEGDLRFGGDTRGVHHGA